MFVQGCGQNHPVPLAILHFSSGCLFTLTETTSSTPQASQILTPHFQVGIISFYGFEKVRVAMTFQSYFEGSWIKVAFNYDGPEWILYLLASFDRQVAFGPGLPEPELRVIYWSAMSSETVDVFQLPLRRRQDKMPIDKTILDHFRTNPTRKRRYLWWVCKVAKLRMISYIIQLLLAFI